MSDYKFGDLVWIINNRMNNEGFFVEGQATVLAPVEGVDGQYLVRFIGRSGEEDVERFVDPAAQTDPEQWVAVLNSYGMK